MEKSETFALYYLPWDFLGKNYRSFKKFLMLKFIATRAPQSATKKANS
jgi:hypothetical protein